MPNKESLSLDYLEASNILLSSASNQTTVADRQVDRSLMKLSLALALGTAAIFLPNQQQAWGVGLSEVQSETIEGSAMTQDDREPKHTKPLTSEEASFRGNNSSQTEPTLHNQTSPLVGESQKNRHLSYINYNSGAERSLFAVSNLQSRPLFNALEQLTNRLLPETLVTPSYLAATLSVLPFSDRLKSQEQKSESEIGNNLNPESQPSLTLQPGATAAFFIDKVKRLPNLSLGNMIGFPSLLASSSDTFHQDYMVQEGDTVNLIANQYRVSSNESIAIENLSNSDLVIDGKTLVIPQIKSTTAAQKINQSQKLASEQLVANSPETFIKSTPASSSETTASLMGEETSKSQHNRVANISPLPVIEPKTSVDDPYIAKLRAEIDALRARYQNQTATQQANNSVILEKPQKSANNNTANSAASGSTSEPVPNFNQLDKTGNYVSEDREESTEEVVSVAPSDTSSYVSPLSTSVGELVSPELPPLSSPEEYLPTAFAGYDWPATGTMTSGYGWRWGRLHQGIDIAAPVGTPILAAASGEVISAGWNSGGYGNVVKMRHLDGSVTLYAHNHRILVRPGQKVNQGQQIAEMGSTGFSTGPHLHFEIRLNGEASVNPMAFLSKE